MAVERRNDKWHIRGEAKLEDGSFKDCRRVARGCKLKKEAIKVEDSFLARYNGDPERMRASNITFRGLTEIYLREKQGSTKSSTLTTGKYMFDQINELYDKGINLIRSKTIKDFIESYNIPEYKLSYVNKMRTCLDKLFSFIVKQNLIERNSISSIPNFKHPDELREKMQFYIPDGWKCFVQTFPRNDIMYYTTRCTLYYMGMRHGEVPALNRKDDVDIVKGTIRVNKTVSQYVSGQRYVVAPPETKNSYRTIKMPEEELQIMKKYLEWYDSYPGASADGFLFSVDQPVILKPLNKEFHRVADAAGLSQTRIHDLRHPRATSLVNHEASVKAIADRLGNTVEEVLKTYSRLFSEAEDTMIQIINNVFKK